MKKYEDPYYLVRKLKPFFSVNSNVKTIYIPEGKAISEKAQKYIELLTVNYNFQIQTTIEVPNYHTIFISRSIGIAGIKIHFLQHKFFGLVPGTMVLKIGAGKLTGDNFIESFSKPYEYCGAIFIEQTKYYAFKIPEELKPELKRDFYMLYSKDKYFVYRKIFKNTKQMTFDYWRKMKPQFKIK